jgi:putative peptide zinc metalloprotease protein
MKIPRLPMTRRTAIGAAALVAACGLGGWALAEGGVPLVSTSTSDTTTTTTAGSPGASTDNVAAAVNTGDGRTVYALALKIVQTDDPVVDAGNAAVAVASCTDCQTVAIALEAVLVAGSPTVFEPTNIALAINTECSNCQTLAMAYQKVVQNDTRVRISGAGRHEIAAIRAELQSLRHSGLDLPAIQLKVNELAGRFATVLETQVYPIGRPAQTEGVSESTTTTTTAAPPSTTVTTAAPDTTTTTTTTTTADPSTTTAVP